MFMKLEPMNKVTNEMLQILTEGGIKYTKIIDRDSGEFVALIVRFVGDSISSSAVDEFRNSTYMHDNPCTEYDKRLYRNEHG